MLDKPRNNEHVGHVAAADAELMFFALQKFAKEKQFPFCWIPQKKGKKQNKTILMHFNSNLSHSDALSAKQVSRPRLINSPAVVFALQRLTRNTCVETKPGRGTI